MLLSSRRNSVVLLANRCCFLLVSSRQQRRRSQAASQTGIGVKTSASSSRSASPASVASYGDRLNGQHAHVSAVAIPPGSTASSRRSPPIIMPDIRQQAEILAECTSTTPGSPPPEADVTRDVVQTPPVRPQHTLFLFNTAQPSVSLTTLVSSCSQVIQKPRVRSGHHAHDRRHVDQSEISQISDDLTAVSLRCEPKAAQDGLMFSHKGPSLVSLV